MIFEFLNCSMSRNIKITIYLSGLLIFSSCITLPKYIPKEYSKTSENSSIYSSYDKFKDVTFYTPETGLRNSLYGIPTYGNMDPFYIYAGKDAKGKSLRIKFIYTGQDWIFFKSAYIVGSNGERTEFSFNQTDKHTHIELQNMTVEIVDIELMNDKLNQLEKVLKSDKVEVRLSGEAYKDYTLNKSSIKSLNEVIDLYKSL